MKIKIVSLAIMSLVLMASVEQARADTYEEKRTIIEKEVNEIADKCWEDISIKDPVTTADMRQTSYEVVNCLEGVLKEKVKVVFKEEDSLIKMMNSIDNMYKANSDFYFTLYNENKYCCADDNDKICSCGTMAQVTYYFPWIESLKKTLVDVIMIEKYHL